MQDSFTQAERELLQQIGEGSQSAYTLVFNQYSKQVFDVAMLYLKDNLAAREVVQEVFLKIWLKREVLPEVKDFSDYLFILTRNHVFDGFKKQAVRIKAYEQLYHQQVEMVNDTDYRVKEREYAGIVERAIAALPPERKKVYIARKEGFSNEEISNKFNISIHTVKKQMQIAVQTVRNFVKKSI
ncbi:sigma-70 family RNA polymerase sigma factor [Chitinophaga sp.]|uniref:RNA polymerase sigma factor n=1 Tax=Chitinophaga sp. TaxID=1869181 RepID=UPI0031E3D794